LKQKAKTKNNKFKTTHSYVRFQAELCKFDDGSGPKDAVVFHTELDDVEYIHHLDIEDAKRLNDWLDEALALHLSNH
jgi:hypothetical protein